MLVGTIKKSRGVKKEKLTDLLTRMVSNGCLSLFDHCYRRTRKQPKKRMKRGNNLLRNITLFRERNLKREKNLFTLNHVSMHETYR